MHKKFTIKNGTITIEDGKITIDFDKNNLIEETPNDCISDNKVKLSELKPGNEFYIGAFVYVVVDHIDGTTKVISKKITHEMAFSYDRNNNYLASDIRKILNSRDYDHITNYIDKHNIVPTQCDTAAMDDSGNYETPEHGMSKDNITILSVKEYYEYYNILHAIPNFTSESQWLSTPVSTKNKIKSFVCTIDRDGLIEYMRSNIQNIGVRPFFTLKSSTEVKPYTDN